MDDYNFVRNTEEDSLNSILTGRPQINSEYVSDRIA